MFNRRRHVAHDLGYHNRNFYLIYAYFSISEQSPLWNCSHLKFLCIIRLVIFHGDPRHPQDTPTQNLGVTTPTPGLPLITQERGQKENVWGLDLGF